MSQPFTKATDARREYELTTLLLLVRVGKSLAPLSLPRVPDAQQRLLTSARRVRLLVGVPDLWGIRLSDRTPGFHPGKRGSTPLYPASYCRVVQW